MSSVGANCENMIVSDGDNDYEIPDELETQFDYDVNRILSSVEFSDEWYHLCEVFDEVYGEYQI